MLVNNIALPRPFFLPGDHGRIFAVYHEPVGAIAPRGNVLVVPAFNEEMNRCRSMVTIQAQALARLGIGTMVVDLYGTGESDGEHGDARWDIWIDNIRQSIAWLDSQPGGCTALLGIRLGVPLALTALQQEHKKRALIAWQAIADGKTYLTQFMRMRIAANMDRTDIPKETTSGMRAQLAEGKSIEVAGYEIHPELATAIECLRLSGSPLPESVSAIAWLEKGSGTENAIPPASGKLIETWQLTGKPVTATAFDGPAFWALHDRYFAPELVKRTSDWLQSLPS